jgi:DNA-directed RNA polymerase specialized sigma24 family protein
MTPEQERLIAALDRLPMVPRLVYLLAATDGLRHEEIAFRLGVSVKEVEAHLSEALTLLAVLLDDP